MSIKHQEATRRPERAESTAKGGGGLEIHGLENEGREETIFISVPRELEKRFWEGKEFLEMCGAQAPAAKKEWRLQRLVNKVWGKKRSTQRRGR